MRHAAIFTESEREAVHSVVKTKLENLRRMRAKGADQFKIKRIPFLEAALKKLETKQDSK